MGIASSDQSTDQTTESVENEVPVEISAPETAELADSENDDSMCSAEEGDGTGEEDSAHPPGGLDSQDPPQPGTAPQAAEPAGGPLSEESQCVKVQDEPATGDSSTISGRCLLIPQSSKDLFLAFSSCSATEIILNLPHRHFGLTKCPRLQPQRCVYRLDSRARRRTTGNPLR